MKITDLQLCKLQKIIDQFIDEQIGAEYACAGLTFSGSDIYIRSINFSKYDNPSKTKEENEAARKYDAEEWRDTAEDLIEVLASQEVIQEIFNGLPVKYEIRFYNEYGVGLVNNYFDLI